jgi:two-component system response regulator HydG
MSCAINRGASREASTLQGATGAATLEDIERSTILQTLRDLGGNKSEAARRLGITRRTLKLKLKKYETEETLH